MNTKNLVGDRDALVIEFKAEKGSETDCVFGNKSKVSSETPAVLKLNQSSNNDSKLVMNKFKTWVELKDEFEKLKNKCESGWKSGKGWDNWVSTKSDSRQLKVLVQGLLMQYREKHNEKDTKIQKLMEEKNGSVKNGLMNTGIDRFKGSGKNRWFDWALISKGKEVDVDKLSWQMASPKENLGMCWDGFSLGDESRWNWSKTNNRNKSSVDWTRPDNEGTIKSECNSMKGNEYVFKLRTYSFNKYTNSYM